MEIKRKDNQIIFKFPATRDRINPYMKEPTGRMDNLVGLIDKRDGEMGFAKRINRDYKGKSDDVSAILVRWFEGEEELKEKCKELGLDCWVIE